MHPIESAMPIASTYERSSASAVLKVMQLCLLDSHMIGEPP
jgi:hypothetical protein